MKKMYRYMNTSGIEREIFALLSLLFFLELVQKIFLPTELIKKVRTEVATAQSR